MLLRTGAGAHVLARLRVSSRSGKCRMVTNAGTTTMVDTRTAILPTSVWRSAAPNQKEIAAENTCHACLREHLPAFSDRSDKVAPDRVESWHNIGPYGLLASATIPYWRARVSLTHALCSSCSRGESLRSETKQHGEDRVQRRMPSLGRAGGEPDSPEVPETEEPRDRYPRSVFKPHRSPSCRKLPDD